MHLFFQFLMANWDTIVGYAGSAGALYGWFSERQKRVQDESISKRDSDMAFYLKTIEAQNEQIEKLRKQVDMMEEKYLRKIDELTGQVDELSEKLALYEPERRKTKPHTTKNA
jgi:predicted RNase H-like nuclease (RuvC/YqgF family)